MRVINFLPLISRADFFQRPEDAIMHGISNPRARRANDELPSIRGARIRDGRCDLTSVTFILSNGMDLRYYVHDAVADWQIRPSDAESCGAQPTVEPVLLRSGYGEYEFDPVRLLRMCLGHEVISMSATLSTAQLLLRDLPLEFFPAAVKETGELLLNWGDVGVKPAGDPDPF